jgi:predicted DNA-binding ArsR family transcriptional regulator
MNEYDANAPVTRANNESQSNQVLPSNATVQNVYSSLESIRKDVILKMEADNKARDEYQARFEKRVSNNQASIAKLTNNLDETKALLQAFVDSNASKVLCIFCGGSHLIAECSDAKLF